VHLGAEGLRVLSDARRMARMRRLAQGAAVLSCERAG